MFSKFSTPGAVLITGGSSGIGEALAIACARRGVRNIFICGRNAERLASVATRCELEASRSGVGAVRVMWRVLDVTDAQSVRDWIAECNGIAPLEVVFSNAGVGTGIENEENVRKTFATNIGGGLNVVFPAIEMFRNRPSDESGGSGRRQIVITASIAGYAPLSTCPAYAATKAAMKSWGLSLRGMLKGEGIAVNVICPGFVRSRITDRNTCPMPFFMEADKAAEIILDRVDRNVGLIAFPWPMRMGVWFMSILPWWLSETVARMLPEKSSGARDNEGIAF